MTSKKRFAAVGTGGRVPTFIDPLVREYSDSCELVGLCDLSPTRAAYHQQRLIEKYGYQEVPIYAIADFERMVRETRPDTIIVCTVDATHHEYIIKAVELGCNVVTEKPMTTDGIKCQSILEAVAETGRDVRVAFNYRWANGATKVRELLANGTIGNIKHVNLEYQLNTSHGADYFRRWHSEKEFSGGLLVHKSTHHFDLVNWWIDAIPQEVFAYGALNFYGEANALARGDDKYTTYDRYTGNVNKEQDPFALTLEEGGLKGLYRDAEADSGYIRDRNVFRAGIDIEDTMSVLVKYRTGVQLVYSLVAFSPEEGFRVTFMGDRGRLEYVEMHGSHIITGQSDLELAKEQEGHRVHLRVIPMFEGGYEVPIELAKGGHGGADPLIQEQIFSPNPTVDPWHRSAGQEQGAASILIGTAANQSIATGLPVRINDVCPLKPEAHHLHELR